MAESGCRNSLNLVWLQIAMCALGLADQTASTPGKWHPGSYHGVVVGRASADTLVRRLGKPLAVTPEEADEPANDYSYGKSGDFGAEIYAVVSKGIVQEIILSSPSLDLRRLLTEFGKRYRKIRYSTDACTDTGSGAALYVDPKGDIETYQFPEKGVVIWVEDDRVSKITYERRAIRTVKKSSCKTLGH